VEHVDIDRDPEGQLRMRVRLRGATLLRQPLYARGTAFTEEQRVALGLEGLLPSHVSTMEDQRRRVFANILRKEDPLEKYIGLAALQDRNEHLFYSVLLDHLDELLPIIYTPTVGRACQQFSHIFRRARGLWVTPAHRGRIHEVLANAPYSDVRLIVVTDNERILGLGDQGAGGMGIPIGKLAIYTAAAGIPPWLTLPVSLDVGTDNRELLEDDLYLGWRFPRLRGAEYDSLVDEFVQAVRRRFPRAVLQWEDFKKANAFRLLDRYRRVLTSFNDDIQGTAAVAVAAMLAGVRITGVPLSEQRVVILGAGAAGVGIARLVRDTLAREGVGGEALVMAVANLDSHGLLVDDRPIDDAHKRDFAWPAALAARRGLGPGKPRDLLGVVRNLQPTVLIGTSGEAGAFDEAVIRELGRLVERPVVLPLSNPTANCEATPADLMAWTGGRALVAAGSPFEPVSWEGRLIRIGQANNAFVFPGVGLGVLVSEARQVTEAMFAAAAERLAALQTPSELAEGCLFPAVSRIRQVSAGIAEAVVREARDSGLGRALTDEEIPAAVAGAMWLPRYPSIEPAPASEPVLAGGVGG
jgi:malic enzyme